MLKSLMGLAILVLVVGSLPVAFAEWVQVTGGDQAVYLEHDHDRR